MFTEPLAGWREATARASKTKTDWAVEVARLLEGRYKKCPTVILVCDNLNTHTIGAFYEAFPPQRARALVRRIRVLPHAQARQLAEHRRKRTEFADATVRFRKTVWRPDDLAIRDRGMVE